MPASQQQRSVGYGQLPPGTAGFTLLEVLVAVIVLSIGLLGAAGLQAKSQQYSRSAYLNTQATVLAHDMLERMRANPQGLLLEAAYDDPAATQHSSCFSLSGCSVAEMAENDMYEWATDIAQKIPGGKAAVCIDSTPDDGEPDDAACDGAGKQYAIKVWWTNLNAETQRTVTTVSF
jgi:type IV pilus assembly protein PilV